MKRAATAFFSQNSITFSLLNTVPTPETVKANNHANTTTGTPAATEKISPDIGEAEAIISGIITPKKSTPL